jgi:hypothetical protein
MTSVERGGVAVAAVKDLDDSRITEDAAKSVLAIPTQSDMATREDVIHINKCRLVCYRGDTELEAANVACAAKPGSFEIDGDVGEWHHVELP